MSRLLQRPTVEVNVVITLTESEIRALEALAGYGDKSFLDTFYKYMGRHYLQPHEDGIKSLFNVVRSDLAPILARAAAAKQAFALKDPVVRPRNPADAVPPATEEAKPQAVPASAWWRLRGWITARISTVGAP